ncbi:hypothetical protein QUF81_06410 [Peribacillus simplex]|uniref:Uncharacterized protein n=1 Tax=Peribacillus simplex TaxID=1478 RepID=A0AAW7IIQ2_9BACI|nr:hypothetical protein [Peribacillus simplex]MDM5292833.1 hypothetical protein [Peribacillus simplex]MDM5451757.1 hypothetical protein [Peribacillus simplex]
MNSSCTNNLDTLFEQWAIGKLSSENVYGEGCHIFVHIHSLEGSRPWLPYAFSGKRGGFTVLMLMGLNA